MRRRAACRYAETFGTSEMYALLVKDSLTKDEIKKVKKLAQTMLAKIKARIHELDHWRDKEETQSIISVLIRDILWAELPESYDDEAKLRTSVRCSAH